MSLADLHSFCLDIAKDVHHFCSSNNIKYSLGYGSLIGAVRHKGYIPWDDDIDIIMPRPDYDRFCQTYVSKDFKLATPENAYIAYARVYDNKKTYCRTLGKWLKKEKEGAFVDIFPLDPVSENYDLFLSQRDRAKTILKLQLDNRGARKNILDLFRILPFKEAIKSLKVTLNNRFFYKGETNLERISDEYQAILRENEWDDSKYCALLAYAKDSLTKQIPIKYWDDLILADFEDTQFYIMKSYDSVLKDIYGDYMKLPPEDQREQHALAIAKFYYKWE